jgi:hypothetical protein
MQGDTENRMLSTIITSSLSPITPYMVVETFPMLFIDNLSPLDIPPLPPLPRY